ncbi:MAG TPA: glucosyltransferase domain-containing protein [Candidatus Didemnitutus sp.]|nr:glucosyltransferase domain-containing protein [Candidatus Didemnitutus sp.]
MRTKICFFVLLLTPFIVYGPAITQEYGMREDYSNLREAKEESGKLVHYYTSQGRPLAGAMIQALYSRIPTVDDLQWLRLLTVALLAGMGLILWRQFDSSGWPEIDAAGAALAIVLLPAAQITASWALGFPWMFSLILSLGGFAAIEMELEKGGLKRTMGVLGGIFIYMMSLFIYQSNAMFAIVPIAAAVMPKAGRRTKKELIRWLIMHLAVIIVAMILNYLLLKVIYADGTFKEDPNRMQLETNPFTKLLWFLWHPVPNALALFAIRDDFFNILAMFYWLSAAAVLGYLVWLLRKEQPSEDNVERSKWWICLAVLPWFAHLISLIAKVPITGYRTLWALSSLVVIVAVTGLRRLQLPKHIDPFVRYGSMGVVLLGAAFFAYQHTTKLVAEPQAREWAIVRDAVAQAQLKEKSVTRFFLVEPTLADRSTRLVHGDEFGSLSSDADRFATEMFNAAVRERYPEGLPKGASIDLALGKQAPADGAADVVIDMRKLRSGRM